MRHDNTRQWLLATTVMAGTMLALGAPASAASARVLQDPSAATTTDPEDGETVEDVVVTGSRIPRNEFTSPSPVQVLTSENAQRRGISDTAQMLHGSTLAAGSPQINSTISSAFVTDGGPGASTISLRGLGANRSLVLLNGRRAGPAGTGGAVSAFDLNVIPQSAIDRVDILKDGASSIYGSDAVAGVVNLITERGRDGGELAVFSSRPFEEGGEQFNVSGSFGRRFDRGYFNVSGDYYRQEMLRAGDRDGLTCKNQYVFEPGTSRRDDRIDPRTGEPHCNDMLWGQVYVYGPAFSSAAPGRFQFDYDGDLGDYIPARPANPAINALFPNAPAGFYVVGYDAASRAVVNASHPFAQDASIIPETDRYTAFAEGAYELPGGAEVYAEVLLNRRESRTDGYRQFWNYTYTNDSDFFGDPGPGDPVTGFSGPFVLSATPVTDHADGSQKVDYARMVLGVRGDVGGGLLEGWKWDVFAQHSRSDGEYTQDVVLDDAIESTNFKTASCVGTNLPISGRPCIDVDLTDPRVLRGDLTPEERAFLFDTETGRTIYEQTYLEGNVAGRLFDLPAGPVGAAFGFHIRRDEILDTPGHVTLADNSWNFTGSGVTKGAEDTREIYAEFGVPLLADAPLAKSLELSLSGRYTETKTSGDAATYKVGLNWTLNDLIRVRATHGTSFRAPALFELYLADRTGFGTQRNVDPCLNLDNRLADGSVTQQLYDNCTNPAGPGGGVPGNWTGGNSGVEIVIGGGLGALEPETSTASVIGLVLTPPRLNLSVALDYYEIELKDEVTDLGANGILLACYLSDHFPSDPICDQFDRDPVLGITQVRDSFINIAQQENRGVDLTLRYGADLPWGYLTLDSQTTLTLENYTALFAGVYSEPTGEVGYPELVGNVNLAFTRGPWTAFWGFDWIGSQSSFPEFRQANGSDFVTIDGRQVAVKAGAEFTGFHSLSLRYRADNWSVTAGLANVFDEKPPAATTVIGQYSTEGNYVFGSQYGEGYTGRRAFVRLSKSF